MNCICYDSLCIYNIKSNYNQWLSQEWMVRNNILTSENSSKMSSTLMHWSVQMAENYNIIIYDRKGLESFCTAIVL
jgi:hypothetical protein